MIWKHLIIFNCFEHLICSVISPGREKRRNNNIIIIYTSPLRKKGRKKIFCLIELSLIQAISKHFTLVIWLYRDMNFFKLIKFFSLSFYSKINSFFHQISWLNEFFSVIVFFIFFFVLLFCSRFSHYIGSRLSELHGGSRSFHRMKILVCILDQFYYEHFKWMRSRNFH